MQNRNYAIMMVAVFTLLQLVVLGVFGYTPYPDSVGYVVLAQQCVSEGDIYPITTELNDYPFLWNMGAINAVVLSLYWTNSVTPLLVLYGVMKGMTAWLLYELAKSLTNDKTALLVLLLYVMYPANYGECTCTHSELPFVFLNMLGLWLSMVRKRLFAGGASMAVANWFRPMGMVFLLALLIYLWLNRQRTLKPLFGYLAMVCFIGCMCYQRTGLFLYQAKTGWMALMDYSSAHDPASMAVRERSDWNVSQKDSAWQALFFDWLQENPCTYVAQMPRKLIDTYASDNVNMCTFLRDKDEMEYIYEAVSLRTLIHQFPRLSIVQWLTVVNLLYFYALLVSTCVSLRHFKRQTHLLPLCIIVLGTAILLLFGHGEARFHIPLMPFVMMLSVQSVYRR